MEQLASLLPIVAIALIFWLLLIRPASRRQKQLRAMQARLAPGDRVMLASGIFGTVTAVGEGDRARLRIADGVEVEVARGAIGQVVEPAPAASDDAPPAGADQA